VESSPKIEAKEMKMVLDAVENSEGRGRPNETPIKIPGNARIN